MGSWLRPWVQPTLHQHLSCITAHDSTSYQDGILIKTLVKILEKLSVQELINERAHTCDFILTSLLL